MTIHLSIVLFLPLAAGLIAAFVPGRLSRWVVLAGSVAVLAYWIVMLADFPRDGGGLHYITNDRWIDELGIHYALGVDGLNLFLIGLTNGLIFGLVALGYTLVYGILQLINFAHGDVFALSGLVASTVIVSVLGLDTNTSVAGIVGGTQPRPASSTAAWAIEALVAKPSPRL